MPAAAAHVPAPATIHWHWTVTDSVGPELERDLPVKARSCKFKFKVLCAELAAPGRRLHFRARPGLLPQVDVL